MKIRAQDLRPGMRVWSQTKPAFVINIKTVEVFKEARSKLVTPGRPAPYLPACVMVTMTSQRFGDKVACHTFQIDEEIETALIV